MATPREICKAKAKLSSTPAINCGFGKPNAKNPSVVFTGCAACKRDSAAGVTVEQAEEDMRQFMLKINRRTENYD